MSYFIYQNEISQKKYLIVNKNNIKIKMVDISFVTSFFIGFFYVNGKIKQKNNIGNNFSE